MSLSGALSGPLVGHRLVPLLGQSNMCGRASLVGYTAPTTTGIYSYANDGQWKIAREPLDDATGQIDAVSGGGTDVTDAGVGPGLAFAVDYQAAHRGARVGLIPCAKGGSAIAEWAQQPASRRDTLYGSFIARTREAMARGTVAAILWFQGEADTKSEANALAWRPAFEALVTAWRADLDNPTLPVVFAQLGTLSVPGEQTHWDVLKDEMELVDIENVSMIVTDDLPALNAGLHWDDASSYVTIGQRFATALLALEAA